MKKRFNTISAIILSLAIFVVSFVSASAEVVYTTEDGFSYTRLSSTTASLYGWDGRSSNLVVPSTLEGYHLTQIDGYAFDGDENITAIDFSNALTLEKINFFAFRNCVNLSGSITLNSHIDEIGVSAFEGCSSLEAVSLQSKLLKKIPAQCFYKCSSLTEVTLPDSLEKINKMAFANCTSLEYLEIPASVTSFGEAVFYGDENLILGVYTDTEGQRYAVDNHIPYMLLDGRMYGDVNNDGTVDVLDATMIQKYAVEKIDLTEEEFEFADVNHDGFADVLDAADIQKYTVGKNELERPIYYP